MTSRAFIVYLTTMFCLATGMSQAQPPAFPGAEGAGMYTTGGRGGKVLYVTSLEDTGEEGTLRWAINQEGARTILFNVSGLIRLEKPLQINHGNVTIAGQSAPGDGICISDYETTVNADNVIIRFLRFRLGDKKRRGVDALSGYRNKNVIIDHCSMSWSIDEISSFYDNVNFTMQWCFVAESLRNSFHNKGKHGYGGIWGGHNASFHHNLIAHNDSRNPRFCGSRYSNRPDLERVDFRNNVIYNWGANNIYAAEGGSYNIVNNYFKPGPASHPNTTEQLINPDADNGQNKQPEGVYGSFFIQGNYLEGSEEVTRNNALGVRRGHSFSRYAPKANLEDILAASPFPVHPVTTHSPREALTNVLNYGGASLARDIHDKRYVDNVIKGNYSHEGSAGSSHGLIDSQNDVGGWPEYRMYNEYTDSDGDGIPDGWLEENHPGKKAGDLNEEGYTYLEVYLNSLVAHLFGNEGEPRPVKRLVVDKSGNGDFTTVQAAIDAVRAFDPDYATLIVIKAGTYYEKIVIPDWVRDLKIIGEDRDKTVLTHNDHAHINNMGTFKTYTLQVRGSGITIENLTIENNAPAVGQAVALHTEGDRIVVKNCNILGNQDTVYTGGDRARLYFQGCHIEGTTDFVFGPATAWFEQCTILCKKNSYITAASTPRDVEFGYIFNRCRVTTTEEVTSVYLGRPWRPHAMTLFMNCELPREINPLGWDNWRNPENEKTARYQEFNNTGEGSETSQRVPWMKRLSSAEAKQVSVKNALGVTLPECAENPRATVRFQEHNADNKIDVYMNGQLFTSLLYTDSLYKPCLFPVLTPSGKSITRGYPLDPKPFERTDHPHHVGVWFNFGDVNGLDFWNNSSAIPPERKHLYGTIVLDSIVNVDEIKGEIATLSSWVDTKRERVLEESTAYRFYGTGNESRTIERITRLTALKEVTLKGNKEGLFAIRVNHFFETAEERPVRSLDSLGAGGVYRNRQGGVGEEEVWGKRTPWVALRANHEGETITLVILDHIENPHYPGSPHARGYGLFSMNNLAGDSMDSESEPLEITLQPGESLTFKHRLVIGGDFNDEEIDTMLQSFHQQAP